MEDFLYIILAAVWLIISFLGGRKKKKNQPQKQRTEQPQTTENQTSTSSDSSDSSEFEDLLEDFFGGEKQKKTPREGQDAPKPAYSEKRDYYDDESFSDSLKDKVDSAKAEKIEEFEGAKAIDDDFEFTAEAEKTESLGDLIKKYDKLSEKVIEEDSKIDVVELDQEQEKLQDFDFDARKAIIYSEIINRRYF